MVAVTAIAMQTQMTTNGTMIPTSGTPARSLHVNTHTFSHKHARLTAHLLLTSIQCFDAVG